MVEAYIFQCKLEETHVKRLRANQQRGSNRSRISSRLAGGGKRGIILTHSVVDRERRIDLELECLDNTFIAISISRKVLQVGTAELPGT